MAGQHKNGKISQIYCHWDGYPTWNGKGWFVSEGEYSKIQFVADILSGSEDIKFLD